MENGKGENTGKITREEEGAKLFEKVENRHRCASCVRGLMDLFCEWIYKKKVMG